MTHQARAVCDARSATGVRVIAVDGSGAGKTTLATELSLDLGRAQVVHTDEFAGPAHPLDWWPTVIRAVLDPLSRGTTATYTPWDWTAGACGAPVAVPPAAYVVLEEVSASREASRPYLAFSNWVKTARELRLQRGLTRDGEETREQWLVDMANEDEYIAREHPDLAADFIVPGD